MYTRTFKTFISLSASEIESKLKEALVNNDMETMLKIYDECLARVGKRMEQKKKLYPQLLELLLASNALFIKALDNNIYFEHSDAYKQFDKPGNDNLRVKILIAVNNISKTDTAHALIPYRAVAQAQTTSPSPEPQPEPTPSPAKEEEQSNMKVRKVRKTPSRKPKTKTPAKDLAEAVKNFNENRAEVERLANEMEAMKEEASEDIDEMTSKLTEEITKIVDEDSKKSEEHYLNNGNITSTLENIYKIMEANKVSTAELVQFLMTKGA